MISNTFERRPPPESPEPTAAALSLSLSPVVWWLALSLIGKAQLSMMLDYATQTNVINDADISLSWMGQPALDLRPASDLDLGTARHTIGVEQPKVVCMHIGTAGLLPPLLNLSK